VGSTALWLAVCMVCTDGCWLLAAGCCCTPSTVHCAPSIVQVEHATTTPPLHPTHRLISVFLLHELKSVYVARKLIYSAFTSFPSAAWPFERMCQVDWDGWDSWTTDANPQMKLLAAYLLLQTGGNASPSASDIKELLNTVGIDAEEERLSKLISELEGKDINEVSWRLDCAGIGRVGVGMGMGTGTARWEGLEERTRRRDVSLTRSSSLRARPSSPRSRPVELPVPPRPLPVEPPLPPTPRPLRRRRRRPRRSPTTTW